MSFSSSSSTRVCAVALTVALAGCGNTVIYQGTTSSGSGGQGGFGGSTSSNVVSVGDVNPVTTTNVTTVGVTTGDVTTGGMVYCDDDLDCSYEVDAVCIHSDGKCGQGEKGVCTTQTFPPCSFDEPSCLCNKTIGQACGTVDVSHDPDWCSTSYFACGNTKCKTYVEYCQEASASPAGGGPDQGCIPAPAACTHGIIDCNCIVDSTNGAGACKDDMMGGVYYAP